jgi:hypothetical protein
MFCPGCGLQISDDLKFCRQCGANLRGVRETMFSRSAEEKFDWSKTWVADMFLTEEERERRSGVTPEEKRLNEIKGGVITTFVGVAVMIFLYFFFDVVAKQQSGNEAEIVRRLWLVGIIPFLIGAAIMINGFFISRRLVKLKEQRTQAALPAEPLPAALPARTTDQLVAEAALPAGFGVTENTTAHLPQPVPAPPRRENN